MLCCYVAVTALLYGMFADADRSLSRLAAAFSMIGIAILGSAGLLHMAPLALLDGAAIGLPTMHRDAMIALSLDLHGDVYAISLVFFGIYCMLIGWLALRSGLLPKAVGALMMLGGACHVVTRFAAILSPAVAHLLPRPLSIAPLIGELALALWLILFGLRRRTTAP